MRSAALRPVSPLSLRAVVREAVVLFLLVVATCTGTVAGPTALGVDGEQLACEVTDGCR